MSGRTRDASHNVHGGLYRGPKRVFQGSSTLDVKVTWSSFLKLFSCLIHRTLSQLTAPLLEIRKSRLEWSAQSHTASKRQRQEWNLGISTVSSSSCCNFSHSTDWVVKVWWVYEVWWGVADGGIDSNVGALSHFQPGWISFSTGFADLCWQVLDLTLTVSHLWACLTLQAKWYHSIVFDMCTIKILNTSEWWHRTHYWPRVLYDHSE